MKKIIKNTYYYPHSIIMTLHLQSGNQRTCCKTQRLSEKIVTQSKDTKLTWTGKKLGSCRKAKFYGNKKTLLYNIFSNIALHKEALIKLNFCGRLLNN